MSEQSLILLKPDAVQRQLIGKIINIYEQKGLKISALKLMQVTKTQAENHYIEHKDKPFFNGVVEYITMAPIIAIVLTGLNAVKIARTLNGATDPTDAAPGSIRGQFAMNKRYNLVHASDSVQSAEREIKIFFNESEIFDYNVSGMNWF